MNFLAVESMSDWSASENAEMVFVNLFDKTNSLETDEISTNSNLKRFYIPTDQELNDVISYSKVVNAELSTQNCK
ncbi:20005_t:CDS:2 [Entrophospora sp. SA101]|nr:20005_t:CDS:2 [Entrophospora sp. SA101]